MVMTTRRLARQALSWINGCGIPGSEFVNELTELADGVLLCALTSHACGTQVERCENVYSERDAQNNAGNAFDACLLSLTTKAYSVDREFDASVFLSKAVGADASTFSRGVQKMISSDKNEAETHTGMLAKFIGILRKIFEGSIRKDLVLYWEFRGATNAAKVSMKKQKSAEHNDKGVEDGGTNGTPIGTSSRDRRRKQHLPKGKTMTPRSTNRKIRPSSSSRQQESPKRHQRARSTNRHKSATRQCRGMQFNTRKSAPVKPAWNRSTIASPTRRRKHAPQQRIRRRITHQGFQAGNMTDPLYKPSVHTLESPSSCRSPTRRRRQILRHAETRVADAAPDDMYDLGPKMLAVYKWLRKRGYLSHLARGIDTSSAVKSIADLAKDGVLLCDLVMRLELDAPGLNRVKTVEVKLRDEVGALHKLVTMPGVSINPTTRAARVKNVNTALTILRKRKKMNSRHLWSVEDIVEGNVDTIWELLQDIHDDYGARNVRTRKVASVRPRQNLYNSPSYKENAPVSASVILRKQKRSSHVLAFERDCEASRHLLSPKRNESKVGRRLGVGQSRNLLSPPRHSRTPLGDSRASNRGLGASLLFTAEMEREMRLSPIPRVFEDQGNVASVLDGMLL